MAARSDFRLWLGLMSVFGAGLALFLGNIGEFIDSEGGAGFAVLAGVVFMLGSTAAMMRHIWKLPAD